MAALALAMPAAQTSGAPRSLPAIETPRLVLRARDSAPGTVDLAILLKPGLAEAGWIGFALGGGADRVAELCFFLAPLYRGRGLMREAARAAAPPALRLLGARGVRATLPADAPAAHEVARALGLAASSRRGPMRRFEKDLCGLL
ncbi:GNAT family N-acetyltransferase [Sphingosinicella sp.]|uniref:GNAT family N-acetyltransferase n=1 Tax=Sphingosinicella sp. TaxID=1917971 RepID=UPI004037CDEE